jgi:hypothetical protein
VLPLLWLLPIAQPGCLCSCFAVCPLVFEDGFKDFVGKDILAVIQVVVGGEFCVDMVSFHTGITQKTNKETHI